MKQETPTPPLGWNSYDSLCGYACEQDLLDNLEVFLRRLAPHGYRYFVTDVGWYGEYHIPEGRQFPVESHASGVCMDAYGRYVPAPGAFPRGFRSIVERVRSAGVVFGVHLMRGIPRPAVEQKLPIFGAPPFTAADIANREDTCHWCHYNYGVNMDHPAAQAYYNSVIQSLADLGVGFVKVDDISHKPREIEAVVHAVEKCTAPMVVSISPGFDVSPANWEILRRANMVRISGDIWDERGELQYALQHWDLFRPLWRPGVWLDLDMIPFGRLMVKRPPENFDNQETLLAGRGTDRMDRFTEDQKRYFLTLRAMAASPLIHGGHLPETDEFSFSLLTHPDILACNQNAIPGERLLVEQDYEVWRTPHRTDAAGGWVGIFHKREQGSLERTFSFEELRLPPGARLRSIWEQSTAFRLESGTLKVTIPPDGVFFAEVLRTHCGD